MSILETSFQLTVQAVLKHMRMREDNRYVAGIVEELLAIACPIARPKALYKVAYVENRDENSLTIGGVTFTSRLLRVNLEGVERVFPYIATCGRELDSVTLPGDDFMRSYTLDVIKELALRSAVNHLETHLKNRFAINKLSRMNPGSLPAWPITDQSRLFAIFGDVAALIGVRLTESSLMIPVKSSSGILFPTEVSFESCRLCTRVGCPGRRATYDPDAARKYGEDGRIG
jgi:hypothetical protein